MIRATGRFIALLVLLPLVAACGAGIKTTTARAILPPPTPVLPITAPEVQHSLPQTPAEDPVLVLIAESDRAFRAGQHEVDLGHVEGARQQFDLAVNVLLRSSYGGRTEPRIREHFDRLVDRISAYEVKALAEGDGFTEKKYEPASLDELLAMSATFTEPAASAVRGAVPTDLGQSGHELPVPLNRRVQAFIDLFQGRLHEFIEEGLKRGSKYLPMIQSVFRAEGLPVDLAYVPLIESAFNPNALSRAKAKGVWQFMRGTGLENGLRQDWFIDERSDPEKATVAAAKYFATLGQFFGNDWHLALASYNGGPGRVQKAVKAGKTDDFWKLAEKPHLLPRETRDYVPMILAAIVVARNPAQYGFDIEPQPAQEFERVTLPRPVDLRRVAEWAGTTIKDIQTLNPELRRWTTPVSDRPYELKVPMGTAEAVNAKLEEASEAELASLRWYPVRKGETLQTIAKKLSVSRADLAEANYLRTTSKVVPGQKLMVPHEATVLMAARTDRPIPAADSRTLAANAEVPNVTSASAERIRVIYEVHKGDTLASIARVFKTSVSALQGWNRLASHQLRAGEKLTIYTARAD